MRKPPAGSDHPDGRAVAGLEYLDAVTRLLQRRRAAQPEREMWEAAEFQWWWRCDRHEDPANARVWSDADGPVAAVVFTVWAPGRFGCEVLAEADFAPAWRFAGQRSGQLRGVSIEMQIIDREPEMQRAAAEIGYVASEESYVASWLEPSQARPPTRPLADGYQIVARSQSGAGPHPMIARNGAEVEQRLRQCSLYDAELDLAVRADDGTAVGYALFWADPVTRVGLVEPMRVEDEHAGRGLATHLLSAGLQRLQARGCTRVKVIADSSNPVSRHLYGAAGFVARDVARVWNREPISPRSAAPG